MTRTYLATGPEIEATFDRIKVQGGHANAARYIRNPWGSYSATMEIIATFPDQPELPLNELHEPSR